MSSIVQLKRSALSGKVPGTGSLNLGELALNTYDGKIFFRRSGSTDTIQEVVTTNVLNTGSVTLTGTLSAESIVGSISASNGVVSGSSQVIGILSSLNSYTASYATTGSNQFTSDQNITGSLRATLTGSFGSLKVNDTLTINHGEAIISGSALVTNDLTILGQVNARQFNISVISSSVLFESGSSRFGNTSDDIHSFTGSVQITGSVTATSFVGDGSGLTGLVLDSELPVDGWDYDSNSDASINDFNNESTKYIIDFAWNVDLGSPVGYKTFISNLNGSTQLIPSTDGIRFIVGNQEVALVGPNGIESVPPAGTVSGSSQLTSSYDNRYVLSGSITQTTWDNIASKPNGIVSGSSQVIGILSSLNTYTASVSTASIENRFTTLENVTSSLISATGSYATTGSNTFRGTQTLSGSIIPAIDNTYDLGSATYQWRDIYVSSGSLYIDGTKVLGSTGNELQITTDVGQSIKILEAGSDSIILQSADGDIQLKTSGGGNLLFDPTTGLIDVRGTLQIQDGYKITSSGGNGIVFGNNIVVSGSFESTGNINGINLTTFSSSIASTFSNQNSATSSYETKGSGIVSGSSQITFSGISSLPTLVSGSSQIDVMSTTNIARLATTGSNTFFGTQTYSGSVYIANDLIVQGSSSIQYISASSVSIGTNIVQLNTANPSVRFAGLSIIDSGSVGGSGSFLYDSVHDEFVFVHRGNGINVTSSHFVLGPETYDSLGNETYLTNNKLPKGTGKEHLVDSNITDTGTLITLGSNTTITGTLLATGTTLVSSSAQVIGILSSLNTYTGSNDTTNTTQNSRLDQLSTASGSAITRLTALEVETANLETFTSSINTTIKTRLNTETVVSGSSQITLSSTTGYGSVLNQAVLTSSSPTFVNLTATGTITETSSLRYKENVETIKYGLDKVLQMRGVTYDKKDNGVKEMGVIAEEIYEVLPEVVLKNEEGDIDSVSYGRITAVLIEAIKDLKKEIEDLKVNR
jgi:hypothetical protein